MADTYSCPLCRQASQRLFEAAGYWICQCTACGHRFANLDGAPGHVERQYGDEYFTGGGAGYGDYLREERLLIHRGRWYARLMRKHGLAGSICDVGAAAGFTLVAFQEAGWTSMGVEPNATMAEYARRHFGLDVHAASFEQWRIESSFDLVTMLQVLPHFVDPAKALVKAAHLVRPGGHLLIETWDRSSLTARLLGRHWHEYSPPSVLHWFSRAGLVRLAEQVGFQPVAQGRPSKWIDAAHAKSILKHKAASSLINRVALSAMRVIPDRLAIPYFAEDLFWLLLRRAGGPSLPA